MVIVGNKFVINLTMTLLEVTPMQCVLIISIVAKCRII